MGLYGPPCAMKLFPVSPYTHPCKCTHYLYFSTPPLFLLRPPALQNDWRALIASPLLVAPPCELGAVLNDVFFRQANVVRLVVEAPDLLVVETSADPEVLVPPVVPNGEWAVAVIGSVLSVLAQPPPHPALLDFGVNPLRQFGLRMKPKKGTAAFDGPALYALRDANTTLYGPWDCVGPISMFVGGLGCRFQDAGGVSLPGYSKCVTST